MIDLLGVGLVTDPAALYVIPTPADVEVFENLSPSDQDEVLTGFWSEARKHIDLLPAYLWPCERAYIRVQLAEVLPHMFPEPRWWESGASCSYERQQKFLRMCELRSRQRFEAWGQLVSITHEETKAWEKICEREMRLANMCLEKDSGMWHWFCTSGCASGGQRDLDELFLEV